MLLLKLANLFVFGLHRGRKSRLTFRTLRFQSFDLRLLLLDQIVLFSQSRIQLVLALKQLL